MGGELIAIRQLPVIEDRLREVKEAWERTAEENMLLVCTEDTIQGVKSARAAMTKQFEELEALRKAIKTQYMASYDAFEATYKECITEPYKRADAALRGKISDTENEIKARCEKKCREYFAELCAALGVDFVKYEYLHIKIDMVSAKQKFPRKLFSQINDFLTRAATGIKFIDGVYTGTDRDEIMSEYKQCLDVGEAVLRVERRKRRVEEERRSAEERAERQKREAEAVAKVEALYQAAVARPVAVEPPKEDPVLTCTFTVRGTRAQLIKVREFMKQEGVEYE